MIKSVWFWFKYKIMLKNKLILTYFIIVIIPIIVLGTFLTKNIYEMTISDKIKTSKVAMNQIKENIASKLLSQKWIIDDLMADINFMNYINTYYEDDYLSLMDYMEKIKPIIERMKIIRGRQNFYIKVYSKNRTIKFSGETNNHIDELEHEKWYQKPASNSDQVYWTGLNRLDGDTRNYYIGCYRVLKDYSNNNSVNAVIVVFLNQNDIYSLITEEKSGGNIVFLFNSNGDIITTTEKEMLSLKESDASLSFGRDINTIENGTTIKYKNSRYLFLSSALTKSNGFIENWKIAYLVPAGGLLSDIRLIWFTSILLSIVCLLASLLITFIVSESINSRISNLIFHMKKVFNGDFKAQISVRGSDEIAILQTDFNSMVNRMDKLITEVYTARIEMQDAEIRRQTIEMKQKKAEIRALQRQINPHYLVNTLESIRMNLVLKDDRETAKIIKMFTETFKRFVYEEKKEYTIREEIDFVDKYIAIRNYRFAGKIEVTYHITEELMTFKIPKLIIQPLVENAISHGLEKNSGEGRIEIAVIKEKGALHITVSDNGTGMERDKLDKVRMELENEEAESPNKKGDMGIALKNIHSRIRLEYGKEYGLQIYSEIGKGTTVSVCLPIDSDGIALP